MHVHWLEVYGGLFENPWPGSGNLPVWILENDQPPCHTLAAEAFDAEFLDMRHAPPCTHGPCLPITALLCILAATHARAESRLYAVDPAHSRVDFSVHYLGLLSADGRFGSVAGTIRFDPDHWEQLSVAIHIATGSLVTTPAFWQQRFLSPGFFDAVRYPAIDFSSERGSKTSPGSGAAFGRLTLHGITRPVTLVTHVDDHGRAVEFDATTSLRRSDFGIVGLLPLVSDEVVVTLHVRGVPSDPPAP